jgi:hypothetical protein
MKIKALACVSIGVFAMVGLAALIWEVSVNEKDSASQRLEKIEVILSENFSLFTDKERTISESKKGENSLNMQQRGGAWYKINSNKPYTGQAYAGLDGGQVRQMMNFDDGEFDGQQRDFYANGQLASVRFFRKGIESLPARYAYSNGSAMLIANRVEGKPQLNLFTKNYNGVTASKENFLGSSLKEILTRIEWSGVGPQGEAHLTLMNGGKGSLLIQPDLEKIRAIKFGGNKYISRYELERVANEIKPEPIKWDILLDDGAGSEQGRVDDLGFYAITKAQEFKSDGMTLYFTGFPESEKVCRLSIKTQSGQEWRFRVNVILGDDISLVLSYNDFIFKAYGADIDRALRQTSAN